MCYNLQWTSYEEKESWTVNGEVWETQQVELKPLRPKLSFDLSIMRSTMVELTTHERHDNYVGPMGSEKS